MIPIKYFVASFLSIVLLFGCSTTQVVRPGGAAFDCPLEPDLPIRSGPGFVGPGVVAIEIDNRVGSMENGYIVSVEDLRALLKYITDLQTAFRTCRTTVDSYLKLNK